MSIKADRIIAVRTGKTVYRDGDTVIKVFDSDYKKSAVLAEALNQARVEETGLHIPRVLEVMKLEDKWAIRSEWIEGKTLRQLLQENPERRAAYMELLVKLQLETLAHECPQLPKLRDKMNARIAESTLDANTRYDLCARLEGMPKHRKLCHGDFNFSNIIVKPDGTPYVLDWAHAAQGNAAADAARTFLLFWLDGDLRGADEYLSLYCEASGTKVQYVQRWMPLVAAAQSVTCRPQEREFLLSWVNVVDYE